MFCKVVDQHTKEIQIVSRSCDAVPFDLAVHRYFYFGAEAQFDTLAVTVEVCLTVTKQRGYGLHTILDEEAVFRFF